MRARGFTLLEVLVALAILAIGLVACLRALLVLGDSGAELRARQAAGWVAQNRLAELRARQLFPPPGRSEGSETQLGRAYYWRAEVRATPNPLFRRVDVTVRAAAGDGHALAELTGFVVQPLQ